MLGKLSAVTDRDFGSTIKHSRQRLGLSQARVAELVGRAPSTVRSWENGRSTPNDFATITSLAAVLALDERELSRVAGIEAPEPRSQLTLEQVLSEITPPMLEPHAEKTVEAPHPDAEDEPQPAPQPEPAFAIPPPSAIEIEELPTRVQEREDDNGRGRHIRLANTEVQASPPPLSVLPVAPPGELSYVEDPTQRMLYRIRSVSTAAGVVAMVFLLLWSFREATAAIDTFWELLTGNL